MQALLTEEWLISLFTDGTLRKKHKNIASPWNRTPEANKRFSHSTISLHRMLHSKRCYKTYGISGCRPEHLQHLVLEHRRAFANVERWVFGVSWWVWEISHGQIELNSSNVDQKIDSDILSNPFEFLNTKKFTPQAKIEPHKPTKHANHKATPN